MTVGVERIDGRTPVGDSSRRWQHRIVDGVVLQERGVEVSVVDRTGVAAGASWGNAGWIAPGLALPLNSPGVLPTGCAHCATQPRLCTSR